MTKPHEETWRWDESRREVRSDCTHPTDEFGDVIVITDSGRYPPYKGGRRSLLVQAPAMARMLLEAEWADCPDGFGATACPWCGVESWGRKDDPKPPHKSDCEWVALMTAAGVIE